MIFHTPIMALLLVSALGAAVAIWAAWFGMGVLRHWNPASGARAQLLMERKTELVSTLFAAVMIAETLALVLFVFNADRMAPLFVGAMCALGTLNVNAWGFPALFAKLALFFAAGLWLVLDRADRAAPDFPLTRLKYGVVLAMLPLVLAAAGMQLAYFLNLRTDVITSCCSKLFTPTNPNLEADLSGLSPGLALVLLAAAGTVIAVFGALVLLRGRGVLGYALASGAGFVIAIIAVISVISPYVYEHPNHHCPFCLLKAEYGYVGYLLYGPLFLATVMGLGAGVLRLVGGAESLRAGLPGLIRRQVVLSLAGFAGFGLVAMWIIWRSNLIVFG